LSGNCDACADKAAGAAAAAAIIVSASRRVKRIDTSNLAELIEVGGSLQATPVHVN
jgi:hypothetical protein